MFDPLHDSTLPYRVLERIGLGAYGAVYRIAFAGDVYALKVLHATDDETQRERFLAEAELLRRLAHPRLVRCFDSGVHEGLPYLRMEYCSGGTLFDYAQRMTTTSSDTPTAPRGRIDAPVGASTTEVAEWIRLLDQSAEGLQVLHAAGVVHRDVKPSNILVREDGACIADLGVALEAHRLAQWTRTGERMGTPIYMAPEQARGSVATPLSDQYSLCATFYRAITGRPTVGDEHVVDPLPWIGRVPPVPPHVLRPGIPVGLSQILMRGLEPDPRDRYPDLAALRSDLALLSSGGTPTRHVPPFHRRVARALTRAHRHGRTAAIVALVLLVAALGTTAWAATRADAQRREALEQLESAEQIRVHPTVGNDEYERRLQSALALGPDLQPAIEAYAGHLADIGDYERLDAHLRAAASRRELSRPLRWLHALTCAVTGREAEEQAILATLPPFDAEPQNWLETDRRCLYLLRAGHALVVRRLLQASTPPQRFAARRLALLARTHRMLGDRIAALDALKSWTAVDPHDWPSRLALAEEHGEQRQYTKAFAAIDEAERIAGAEPFDIAYQRMLLEFDRHRRQKRWDDLVGIVDAFERAHPPKTTRQRALLAYDRVSALAACGLVDEIDPEQIRLAGTIRERPALDLYVLVARINARMAAARAAASDPEAAARVRATTEEIAAIETCTAAAANRRESLHLIRRQVVRAWVEIREAARAMPTTKAWVEADPRNVDAHVAHAAVLRLCGDPTAALPYARKAVELDPLQPEARETLVQVIQDLMQRGGRDTDAAASRDALAAEAIEALQPLVDGESPNAENFVNLSYMHFQRKNPADFDAAIRVATDGLRAFPGEVRLTTNLAVYFVRGTSTPLLPRFALDHSTPVGSMQPRLLFEAAFAVRDFDAMVDYVRGYETWLTQPNKHPQFTAQHRPMILRCLQFSIGLPYCPPDVADYFSAFLAVR